MLSITARTPDGKVIGQWKRDDQGNLIEELGMIVRFTNQSDYVRDTHGSIIVFSSVDDIIDAMPSSFSMNDVTIVKLFSWLKNDK